MNTKWIVIFADHERGIATFDDEVEANEFYERAVCNWTCSLYELVKNG